MRKLLFFITLSLIIGTAFTMSNAFAQGMAEPWQLGFQSPATSVMEKLYNIHDFLLVVITIIAVGVLLGLLYISIRFRKKANPVPSKTAHNTKVEVIWTVVPILILVVIAIPSLRIHYFMQRVVEPEMTIKVTGYQWYWNYSYPDHGGLAFDSYIKKDPDLKPGEPRLLTVDNNLVVPVNTKIRVQITAADVLHAWAVPAFGIKRDAVPGRLNETWFEANKTGVYYGQCSELCGVGHGFMPIAVEVVTKPQFAAWVKKQRLAAGLDKAPEEKKIQQTAESPAPPVVAQPVTIRRPGEEADVAAQNQQ